MGASASTADAVSVAATGLSGATGRDARGARGVTRGAVSFARPRVPPRPDEVRVGVALGVRRGAVSGRPAAAVRLSAGALAGAEALARTRRALTRGSAVRAARGAG